MRRRLYRLFGLIPRDEPRVDFAISDGKLFWFEQPVSVWRAVARINRER